MNLHEQLAAAAAHVRQTSSQRVDVGLILGSGLGGFANRLENPARVDYAAIPGFPRSTVEGHAGQLVLGQCRGVACAAMQGRVHAYEGHSAATVAFGARVLITLGARILIITNAAGGLHADWPPGTLMLIRDHLNLTGQSALTGVNDERLGPRFPDMTDAYSAALAAVATRAAASKNLALQQGIYAGVPGPTYETPAEVAMLTTLGADACGMSTVHEVVAARHMGARVLGISCITNYAAGITNAPLSHRDVTEVASRVRPQFESLLEATIAALHPELHHE